LFQHTGELPQLDRVDDGLRHKRITIARNDNSKGTFFVFLPIAL
jgi:hypothetical protein